MAKNLEFDNKVKTAEDAVITQRKEDIKKLKAIKGYLTGIKTGDREKIYAQNARSSKTMYK